MENFCRLDSAGCLGGALSMAIWEQDGASPSRENVPFCSYSDGRRWYLSRTNSYFKEKNTICYWWYSLIFQGILEFWKTYLCLFESSYSSIIKKILRNGDLKEHLARHGGTCFQSGHEESRRKQVSFTLRPTWSMESFRTAKSTWKDSQRGRKEGGRGRI